jgi:hypothetical protein
MLIFPIRACIRSVWLLYLYTYPGVVLWIVLTYAYVVRFSNWFVTCELFTATCGVEQHKEHVRVFSLILD